MVGWLPSNLSSCCCLAGNHCLVLFFSVLDKRASEIEDSVLEKPADQGESSKETKDQKSNTDSRSDHDGLVQKMLEWM